MSMLAKVAVMCVGILSAATLSITASAQSANVNWGPWQFRWEVADSSGIVIRGLFFEGRQIMHKGSLPVIRVHYNNNQCGPYADRISWQNLDTNNNCRNNSKVCQRQFTLSGRNWLEISGRAFIGSYDIIQAWYFSDDGEVHARIFSRGLQCVVTHRHHAYWMLDFDVDGPGSDEVFLHSPVIGNLGFGQGWFRYSHEWNSWRNIREVPIWFMRDSQTLRGVYVIPGVNDGQADDFSRINAGIRKYNPGETGAWAFGASGELGYDNRESVIQQDNVIWYVGHLFHAASEGPNHYHAVGPVLRVRR